MGLRFRKSVKICNGLRLNFGKTGASVTVGSGPFKKTFNTNGNVTTTVGLPGTGIYWTETERGRSKNNRSVSGSRQTRETLPSQSSDYQVPPAVDAYFTQGVAEDIYAMDITGPATPVTASGKPSIASRFNTDVVSSSSDPVTNIAKLSANDIKRIYLYEDAPVDWTEIIAGATADDLLMDPGVHSYCLQMAPRILSGDVDAYLEVIERMRPVDDLALYSGDFEFGTDDANYIEVEFATKPERVLRDGTSDDMLEEFVSAVAVRVARDLFALLPVSKVLVHVEINGDTVLSVIFSRNQLYRLSFRNENASSIVKVFLHQAVKDYRHQNSVARMQIG